MENYTIGPEKHEEIVKDKAIGGLNNFAGKPSDLADQWSRSGRHIAIGSGKRRLSEAAI